jgi:hypothetical protein
MKVSGFIECCPRGDGPRRSSQKPGRALQIAEVAKSKSKTPRRGRRRSNMVVSAAPAHASGDAAE